MMSLEDLTSLEGMYLTRGAVDSDSGIMKEMLEIWKNAKTALGGWCRRLSSVCGAVKAPFPGGFYWNGIQSITVTAGNDNGQAMLALSFGPRPYT